MPRRSDATRAQILRAAQARFAADGYPKATIRAIAADADIDPSMVMRYYGNKAKLFAAAVDVDLRLPDLTAIPKRHLGRTLVAHFLHRWEGDPTDDALLMLLRDAGGQPRSICGTRPALTLIAAATSRWAGRGSHGDRDLPLLRSGSAPKPSIRRPHASTAMASSFLNAPARMGSDDQRAGRGGPAGAAGPDPGFPGRVAAGAGRAGTGAGAGLGAGRGGLDP